MSIAITGPLQGDVHVSDGSQKSSGFEFDFTVEAIRDWFLSAKNSYTYAEYIRYNALSVDNDGKLTLKDFSGNTPLFVPNQILYLKLYKEFGSGLSMGSGLRFVSAQYANYENDFEIEKYVVYQAHIAYQSRHWLFQLNTDKYSKDNLYFRGLGPYSVIPVEPLEIRFSVEAVF